MDVPRKRPPELECEPESQRLLVERIARLINPDAWRHWDECAQVWPNPYARPGGAFVADSLEAARRVIDGLHLDIISSRHSFDGHRHRYDLTGHFREDL